MPIKNYTTKVPASKTVGEMQEILAKHGASRVIANSEHPAGEWYVSEDLAAKAWNDRYERECAMSDMETGFQADLDCSEHVFHCWACNAERGVYAYDEDGNVWAEMPKRCPECGAKVVER